MRSHHVIGIVSLLAFLPAVRAEELDLDLTRAEKTLQENHIEAAGTALIRFFRERTPTDDYLKRLPEIIRRLGDEDFETRDRTSQQLIRMGRMALAELRKAQTDSDLERARRARDCIEAIENKKELVLIGAAVRVMEKLQPEETVAVLLAYLPAADDDIVEAAIFRALQAGGVKAGRPDAAVVKALTDAQPLRRAAAAHILGRNLPAQRDAVLRLLKDRSPRVRLEAADALVRHGEKAAIPVLIALLEDGPMPVGWRVQEMLFCIAGDKFPAVVLSDEDRGSRVRAADAWRAWWKDAAATTDLSKINLEEAMYGINVFCEVAFDRSSGRVWSCRADGNKIWEIKDINAPCDVQLLPGGRVLIAEYQANRVTERDRDGKILWEKKCETHPTTCRLLTNGNTFIAAYGGLMEVTPAGKTVCSFTNPVGGDIYRAHRLPNSHFLFVCDTGKIVELNEKGNLVRTIVLPPGLQSWGGVELLPGDRFLVTMFNSKVIEINAEGKVLWEYQTQDATSAVRLPNGNTLISCLRTKTVLEVNRAGKQIWSLKLNGEAFRAVRY